jgi:hypothetical protein
MGIYPYQTEFRDLPDDARRAVSHQFDSREMAEGTKVHSLTDHSVMRLPKNFNSYFLNYDNQKVFVASSSERPSLVKDELEPVSSVENLVTLYETYKKDIKSVNTKQVSDAARDLEKAIDGFTGTMKVEFTRMLEMSSPKPPTLDELQQAYTDVLKQNNYGVCDELGSIIEKHMANEPMGGRSIVDLYNFYRDKPNFKEAWATITSEICAVYDEHKIVYTTGQAELTKEFKEILTDLQGFLISMLTSIQVALRDITVKVIAVQTEVRYELIRYLYNCQIQYK